MSIALASLSSSEIFLETAESKSPPFDTLRSHDSPPPIPPPAAPKIADIPMFCRSASRSSASGLINDRNPVSPAERKPPNAAALPIFPSAPSRGTAATPAFAMPPTVPNAPRFAALAAAFFAAVFAAVLAAVFAPFKPSFPPIFASPAPPSGIIAISPRIEATSPTFSAVAPSPLRYALNLS